MHQELVTIETQPEAGTNQLDDRLSAVNLHPLVLRYLTTSGLVRLLGITIRNIVKSTNGLESRRVIVVIFQINTIVGNQLRIATKGRDRLCPLVVIMTSNDDEMRIIPENKYSQLVCKNPVSLYDFEKGGMILHCLNKPQCCIASVFFEGCRIVTDMGVISLKYQLGGPNFGLSRSAR